MKAEALMSVETRVEELKSDVRVPSGHPEPLYMKETSEVSLGAAMVETI